jgi:anaphase-promoting complex subunit 4
MTNANEVTTTGCFFKSIDEKHLSQEVKQMLWNPRMDLIALAFANGDVHLYRMSWQKVWILSNPQLNVTITSMAWRPDGKGYSFCFKFFCIFEIQ